MIDVVYDLFNAFGISTKPGRLMLLKLILIKISEKIFNEQLLKLKTTDIIQV